MKYIIFIIAILLVLASIGTWSSLPDVQTTRPVVYWVTDANPARVEQVAIFQRWLKKHNYPDMELRVDSANRDIAKMIIQGVSGVGGDTIDVASGAGMRYFHSMGLLEPVTEQAKRLGYGLDKTYPPIRPELALDGEQYMFPCNVYATVFWVNKSTFQKAGVQSPPTRWDFETFERIGKEFVKKTNTPGERRRYFMANRVDPIVMMRSLGLSRFNETLTSCTYNDPRYAKALSLMHKWTFEDHILPTASDVDAFDTDAGYGGPALYLFDKGNYAMFGMGRYALIRLRDQQRERLEKKLPMMELDIVEQPHGGFPNTNTGTRAAAVYVGSHQKDLAVYFQAFLASKDYNMQVVRDADALPPNPIYTHTQAFSKPLPLLPNLTLLFEYEPSEKTTVSNFRIRFYEALDEVDRGSPWSVTQLPRPPKPKHMDDAQYAKTLALFDQKYEALLPVYRSEWGLHEKFIQTMDHTAIAAANTPFVVSNVVDRITRKGISTFMNNLATAEQTSHNTAQQINAEIERTLSENPNLQKRYDQLTADQAQIDALRQAGKKVPVHLIRNPFYRAYYLAQGWLAETP